MLHNHGVHIFYHTELSKLIIHRLVLTAYCKAPGKGSSTFAAYFLPTPGLPRDDDKALKSRGGQLIPVGLARPTKIPCKFHDWLNSETIVPNQFWYVNT